MCPVPHGKYRNGRGVIDLLAAKLSEARVYQSIPPQAMIRKS